MVGRACGRDGIAPVNIGNPNDFRLAPQDTTGPMTRDELERFSML